ncbi:MAG: hypothetical protein QNK11_03900, partial [Legionella sp.]|nr:hypothetical protein [Legionella sp.]
YMRGTYADFDVEIDASGLPDSVSVDAPILLNVGSVVAINLRGLPSANLESISLSNDIIAVVGDDSLALEMIRKIQQAIYDAYHDNQVYRKMFNVTTGDILAHVVELQKDLSMGMNLLNQMLSGSPSAEYEASLMLSNGFGVEDLNPISLRKAILEGKVQNSLGIPGSLDFTKEKKSMFIKRIVLSTTGPDCISLALFSHFALQTTVLNEKVKPYSFRSYHELGALFYSTNGHAFHTTSAEASALSNICNNDLSWLESGVEAMAQREKKMDESAYAIQSMWKRRQMNNRSEAGVSTHLDCFSVD